MFVVPIRPARFFVMRAGAIAGSPQRFVVVDGLDGLRRLLEITYPARFRYTRWETIEAEIYARRLTIHDEADEPVSDGVLRMLIQRAPGSDRLKRHGVPKVPFRQAPVPFVGRRRRGFASLYRAPRCRPFIAGESAAAEDAADVRDQLSAAQAARLARQERHVTAWDDIPRRAEKSWKRQRLTRWRE